MTPSDDDDLRWDPDARPERTAASGSSAPNGWVRTHPDASGSRSAPTTAPLGAEPAADTTPEPDPEPDPGPNPQGRPSRRRGSSRRGRRRGERDAVRSIVEWVAVIVGALVVALVVKTFLFQAFYIPSASMEPTLEKGDRVLVNKLSYDLHDINRGDIVVFERPEAWEPAMDDIEDLIKRVVGLPGEVVELRDGAVFIDGERLDERYLSEGTRTNPGPRGTTRWSVPEDHVFVMGDNRGNSADSRFYVDGFVPADSVIGRAFIQVWPPTDVGGI